jgi:hypothetical protein
MKTIGIRAAPGEVTFAVYDTESSTVVNLEEIVIPKALTTPESLKYVRSNLLDILREYEIEKAGIRTTEPTAQRLSIDRIQIEGVVQEAFASSSLVSYFAGSIATIASKLGVDRVNVKKMVEGDNILEVENWKTHSDKGREAILTAKAAANV